MTPWLDAQLSPALAPWLATTCGVECVPVRDLGLRDAEDTDIFVAGRAAGAIIVTKDADFVRLLEQLGPPPQVVWITCGNTSNARLRVPGRVPGTAPTSLRPFAQGRPQPAAVAAPRLGL